MGLSQKLAEHLIRVQYEDIPASVVEVTKECILDTIGVILAANKLGEGCQAFVNVVLAEGGEQQATILGYGEKVPASAAAFVNGAMAHAMDFGESHDTAFVHASSPTVPAALALAEAIPDVSGKDLITAVTLGNDLVCRLGLAIEENLLEYGWYMPPILGAFGATAAAGKLLQLTEEQMLDAFSLTLCQATCSAEITQNPQSLIRSIRDAFAAKTGVLSALLAKEGIKGFNQPLEGKKGFFYAFARGNYRKERLVNDLGEKYEGQYVSFKPWPSCRGTHPYIECLLKIIAENQINADEVVDIKAVVSVVNQTLICEPLEEKRKPTSAINAKFSLPYVLATALIHGKVTLEQFCEEALDDSLVLSMAKKIRYEVNNALTMKQSLHGYLEVKTKNNVVFSEKVEVPYGNPHNPMTREELTKKFLECSKYAHKKLSVEKLNDFVDKVFNLELVKDVREITEVM